MPVTSATVSTAHASRYLQQLCKHWAHKFEVSFDPRHGTIALPFGVVTLAADEGGEAALHVTIELAEGADAARAREVVAEHLGRFAFREALLFEWK